jgi:hypothetical protein
MKIEPIFSTKWERDDYERQKRGEPTRGPLGSAARPNPNRPWEDDRLFDKLHDVDKLAMIRLHLDRIRYSDEPGAVPAVPPVWIEWLMHKAEYVVSKQGMKA